MAAPRRLTAQYWRPQSLMIPPDSPRAWMRLAGWEFVLGVFLYSAVVFGSLLIVNAPQKMVTVFDLTRCYATPVVLPCERVAYRTGGLDVLLNFWCGLLLIAVAVGLLLELWSLAAPAPITDDFLHLLHDSFGRDWRRPRTWPWARVAWAYGFTSVGVAAALAVGLVTSSVLSPPGGGKAPAVNVETRERFRPVR